MLRKALVVLAILVVVAGVAFAVVKISDRDTADKTASDEVVLADGSLASVPEPLSDGDLSKLPEDSPERAVMEFIYWAQWGNLPAIVRAYAPEVVDGLGVERMTGAFSFLRPQLAISKPRIASVQKSGDDEAFVTLELYTANDPPQPDSFLVRQVDGEWSVVFDTLLERGLNSYVQQLNAKDPADPDAKAIREGDEAAQLYRNIAPSIELQATEPASR